MNINLIFKNMIKKEKSKFNLEEAKNGAEVVTDCGFIVKILSYDLVGIDRDELVGILSTSIDGINTNGKEFIGTFNDESEKYIITFDINCGEITGIMCGCNKQNVNDFIKNRINEFKDLLTLDDDSFEIKIQKEVKVTYKERVKLSSEAMLKITDIMETDKRFGGIVTEEDWKNNSIYKFCIECHVDPCGGKLDIYSRSHEYHFLAFHTEKQCTLFLKEHEDLVKQYLMLN